MQKLLKSAVAIGVSAALFNTTTVWAQSGSDNTQAEDVEKITVTGSRIQRIEAESAAPVQVFTAHDMKKSSVIGMSSKEMSG